MIQREQFESLSAVYHLSETGRFQLLMKQFHSFGLEIQYFVGVATCTVKKHQSDTKTANIPECLESVVFSKDHFSFLKHYNK